MYTVYPKATEDTKFPLMAFMSGPSGKWHEYEANLKHYASHGFVVVFPFVKSSDITSMNSGGNYIIKAIEYAKKANGEASSPLHNLIDLENKVISGHSMGATSAIEASRTLVDDASVKLTVA